MKARFLHLAGLLLCMIGLGLVLLLTTSRFYSAPATNPSQLSSEIGTLVDQAELHSSLAQLSNPEITQKQASIPAKPKVNAPPFAIPQSSQVEENDAAPLNSTLSSKNTSQVVPLESRNAITRLVIPDLRLDAQVNYVPFQGNTWELDDLGQSVAWLGNTTDDLTVRNLVLAGHITVRDGSHGPFRYLSRLTPGARLIVYSERYIYTYQVRELYLVYPQDAQITENTTESQLTLLTCATWNEKTKTYLRRQIVVADLEKVESYPKSIVN